MADAIWPRIAGEPVWLVKARGDHGAQEGAGVVERSDDHGLFVVGELEVLAVG